MGSSSVGATNPAQAAEEKKRKEENARLSAHEHWFAQNYGTRFGITRYSWEEVREGNLTEEEKKEREAWKAQAQTASISNGLSWSNFPLKDGLYRAVDEKYKEWSNLEGSFFKRLFKGMVHHGVPLQNMFINVENGVATVKPPLSESEYATHPKLYMEKFRAQFGQVMDFMAVHRGLDSIVIDLQDMQVGGVSQYDYERINTLLKLAEERGLKVQFGGRIHEVLENRPTDRDNFFKKLQEHNDTVESQLRASDKDVALDRDKYFYENKKTSLDDIKKLEGDNPEAKQQSFKDELDRAMADKSGTAKLTSLEEVIKSTEKRMADLNKAQARVAAEMQSYDALMRTSQTKQDVSFLDAVDKNIAQLETRRAQLIEAMKGEYTELEARRKALVDVAKKETFGLDAVPAGSPPLKEDEKKANEARFDALKEKVDKLEAALKGSAPDALKEIQVDKVNKIKEDAAKLRTQLEAQKLKSR